MGIRFLALFAILDFLGLKKGAAPMLRSISLEPQAPTKKFDLGLSYNKFVGIDYINVAN